MKTLVTGGAGFIGSHLVDALVEAGHQVTVVDDLSRGTRAQVHPDAELVQCDVAGPLFANTLTTARADVVFHLAAQIDVRVSVRDPLGDAHANVLGTVNLLDAARRHDVRRVVFASSGGTVYGETDLLPTPEDHPIAPTSPYGAAKVSAELYGEMFHRAGGLEFVALRYANVYGPRQDPHGEAGVVAIFATRLLSGAQAVINGDGRQTRDYVYVDDVIQANLRAMDCSELGPFNVGTGVETDVNDLYDRIANVCGSDAPPLHGESKPGEQRRSALATDRARDQLGWEPATSLDSGLRRTVDFFRRR